MSGRWLGRKLKLKVKCFCAEQEKTTPKHEPGFKNRVSALEILQTLDQARSFSSRTIAFKNYPTSFPGGWDQGLSDRCIVSVAKASGGENN